MAEAEAMRAQHDAQLEHWRQQYEQYAVQLKEQYEQELRALNESRASMQMELDAMSVEVLGRERHVELLGQRLAEEQGQAEALRRALEDERGRVKRTLPEEAVEGSTRDEGVQTGVPPHDDQGAEENASLVEKGKLQQQQQEEEDKEEVISSLRGQLQILQGHNEMLSDDVADHQMAADELRQALDVARASCDEERAQAAAMRRELEEERERNAALRDNERAQGVAQMRDAVISAEAAFRREAAAREQALQVEQHHMERRLREVAAQAEGHADRNRKRQQQLTMTASCQTVPDFQAALTSTVSPLPLVSEPSSGVQEAAAARADKEVEAVAAAVSHLAAELDVARSHADSAHLELTGARRELIEARGRLEGQRALLEQASGRVAELEGDLASALHQVRDGITSGGSASLQIPGSIGMGCYMCIEAGIGPPSSPVLVYTPPGCLPRVGL